MVEFAARRGPIAIVHDFRPSIIGRLAERGGIGVSSRIIAAT